MRHIAIFGSVLCGLTIGCRADATDPGFRLVVSCPRASRTARIKVVAARADAFQALESRPLTDAEWEAILSLSVKGQSIPVDGKYRVEDGRLVYESRFGLVGGTTYEIRFDPAKLLNHSARPLRQTFTVARAKSRLVAAVSRVYPSADQVPCNQLKFYIFFSHPMREGDVFAHLKIMSQNGKAIATPFREVELWNETRTRLTLYIHPGRIKRGVALREEMGPVLEAGQRYTLVIGKELTDANGAPLVAAFRKTFRTAAPDRSQPDIKRWKLSAPRANTTGSLELRFDESLDYALLHRMVRVERGRGPAKVRSIDHRVAGTIVVDDRERRWQFTPNDAWPPGAYRVVVDTLLEDLAGNSLRKPFEVDIAARPSEGPPTVTREFVVR